MARALVSDELWELVEPLIPEVPRRYRFPGRKRLDDRGVLTGILFVLRTGIPWEYLPQLAPVAGVAGGGCLAAVARAVVGEAAGGGADRLVASGDRQLARAGVWGGRQDRAEPGRPLPLRLKAPPDRLWPRHATRDLADRRQP